MVNVLLLKRGVLDKILRIFLKSKAKINPTEIPKEVQKEIQNQYNHKNSQIPNNQHKPPKQKNKIFKPMQ